MLMSRRRAVQEQRVYSQRAHHDATAKAARPLVGFPALAARAYHHDIRGRARSVPRQRLAILLWFFRPARRCRSTPGVFDVPVALVDQPGQRQQEFATTPTST